MKKTIQAVAMSRVLHIDYYWRCESFKKGIPPKLAEALEESAEDRIKEKMGEGYLSGELIDYVNMDIPGRRTPMDGWECHGWWNLKKEDEPTPKLNTVNVIEEDDGAIIRMASFEDNKEGNALAEKFFEELMQKRPEFSKPYLKTCLESGMFEALRYRILIVHSTEPTK